MKTKSANVNAANKAISEEAERVKRVLAGKFVMGVDQPRNGTESYSAEVTVDWRKRYLDLEPEHRHIEQLENNERKRESLQTDLGRATLRAQTLERENAVLREQLVGAGEELRERQLQIGRQAKLIEKLRLKLKPKSKAR